MSDEIKTTDAPLMCCDRVRAGSDGWRTRYRPCSRKATVERDGKRYCGQHDPHAVAERRQRLDAEGQAKFKEQLAQRQLERAAPDLLAALEAVVSVADRKTDEFDQARAAIAKARGVQNVE